MFERDISFSTMHMITRGLRLVHSPFLRLYTHGDPDHRWTPLIYSATQHGGHGPRRQEPPYPPWHAQHTTRHTYTYTWHQTAAYYLSAALFPTHLCTSQRCDTPALFSHMDTVIASSLSYPAVDNMAPAAFLALHSTISSAGATPHSFVKTELAIEAVSVSSSSAQRSLELRFS